MGADGDDNLALSEPGLGQMGAESQEEASRIAYGRIQT